MRFLNNNYNSWYKKTSKSALGTVSYSHDFSSSNNYDSESYTTLYMFSHTVFSFNNFIQYEVVGMKFILYNIITAPTPLNTGFRNKIFLRFSNDSLLLVQKILMIEIFVFFRKKLLMKPTDESSRNALSYL